ncbi:MAG: recombinase family protein [Gemmatimonadetes bacterium]|nr:recombinase family protein [Gemmatimonadota bacterium]
MTMGLHLATQFEMIPRNARVIAYTRVSTEEQGRSDAASLRDQREACEAFAAKKGLKVDAVLEDRMSGRSLNRPGFKALFDHCEKNPRHGSDRGFVICLDSSRWGRFVERPSLANTFADRLYLVGWDLHFVREPSTGNLDADVFLGSARSVASATESRRIAYRAHTGMMAQAKAGHWQGRAPFGYDRSAVNTGTGRERRLTPYEHAAKGERVKLVPGDSQHQAALRDAFRLYANGDTLEQIAERFNARSTPGPFDTYPNRGGVTHWTPHTVRSILGNPVYVGTHRFNRRTPCDAHGKRGWKPREDWVLIEDTHPPLVKRGIWDRVQKRFAARGPLRRDDSSPYLLTGILRCAKCGGPVVGGGGSRPKESDPHRFRFYKCACSSPRLTVNQRFLEDKVVGLVGSYVRQSVESGKLARVLDEMLGERSGEGKDERAKMLRQRRDLERQRDRLVDAVATGAVMKEEAATKLKQIRSAIERVTEELERGRFQDRSETLSAKERADILALAADFTSRIKDAPTAVARQLVAPWIDSIILDGDERTATVNLNRIPAMSCAETSPAAQP